MDTKQEIETRLQALRPTLLQLRDDSHLHIGHAGNKGGGHYHILVVNPAFEGISRINRQRMVKDPLHDLFSDGLIHALSIKAVTPDEHTG